MKLSYLFLCWLGFAVVLSAPMAASAQSAQQIAAFEAGDYEGAAPELDMEMTADEAAFLARVSLSAAMSGEGALPEVEPLLTGLAAARHALELDPKHIEGRLQLAIALSLSTRAMTTRRARKSGLGEQAKALVESVLADDPANINAHGFMMVWHLEVMRRGGRLGAMVMGASVEDARKHYAAAMTVDARDASVHWQYARALALLDAKKHRASITAALEAAEASPCETQLEEVMQARAIRLLKTLNDDGPKAAEVLAGQML